MTGTWISTDSKKEKKSGNWKCVDNYLFYKDCLVCYIYNGLLFTKEEYINKVHKVFSDLGIISFVTNKNESKIETIVNQAISSFISNIKESIDIPYTTYHIVNKLNCKFENLFLNHCKNVTFSELNEIILKKQEREEKRKEEEGISKAFDGLWYR